MSLRRCCLEALCISSGAAGHDEAQMLRLPIKAPGMQDGDTFMIGLYKGSYLPATSQLP